MSINLPSNHSNNEPEVMSEINTTPLIDVMLVLLIMLIITIPAQLHSINLDMASGKPPVDQKKPNIVHIEIDASNTVFWDGKLLEDTKALQTKLEQAKLQNPEPELHIHAQAQTKYKAVASVMANAQRQGLSKLGIVGSEQFATP
jgi:biopolymer transport protein ExbD